MVSAGYATFFRSRLRAANLLNFFSWPADAITTEGGNLVITLSETPIHNLNFKSGMLQTWNKFCFTTGYIEGMNELLRPLTHPFTC